MTVDDHLSAFARLGRADGFRVRANRRLFTRSVLATADILIIVNARAAPSSGISVSAFSGAEINAVRSWVGARSVEATSNGPGAGHFRSYELRNGFRVPTEGDVGWYVDDVWRAVWKGTVLEFDPRTSQ